MPLAGSIDLHSPRFWAGLLAVTFPLNLVVYGWNDLVDRETDRANPRKDSWLFGARGTDAQLDALPRVIWAVGLLTTAALAALAGIEVVAVAAVIALFCAAYNHPTRGLRGRPPGDLLCQVGYLLTVVLGCVVNDVSLPPIATWAYLSLFCAQSQLIGEVMDIGPDRSAGRSTTATVLGSGASRLLVLGIVTVEIALLAWVFEDHVFAAGMGLFWAWLVLDRFWLFPSGTYGVRHMKLLGVGGNLAAIASIGWVQVTGLFAAG